jgi:hypothetical protein
MKRNGLIYIGALALCGCVSITPQAEKIQLHPSNSTQLQGCKKLGPISAEASAWKQMTWSDLEEQAKNNLREAAGAKWGDGVDSVALINMDKHTEKLVANGIAYKCF